QTINLAAGTGEGRAVRVTSTGSVVASGMIDQNFGVTRLNATTGALEWIYTRNGTGNATDTAFGVTLDASDNVFAAGFLTNNGSGSDFTTVKLAAATGVESWRREVSGGASDQALAVAIDSLGNPIAAGFLRGPDATPDFAVIKFAGATGLTLFQRTIAGAGVATDQARAIAVDADDNVLAGGSTDATGLNPEFVVIKASGVDGGDITCGDAV